MTGSHETSMKSGTTRIVCSDRQFSGINFLKHASHASKYSWAASRVIARVLSLLAVASPINMMRLLITTEHQDWPYFLPFRAKPYIQHFMPIGLRSNPAVSTTCGFDGNEFKI